MSFTSFHFFLFLIVGVIVYYIIPKKVQWVWLLILSYYYYFTYSFKTIVFLLFTTVVTYSCGIALEKINEEKPGEGDSGEDKKLFKKRITHKKKCVVVWALVLCFGILAGVKYTNFAIKNINSVIGLFKGTGRISLLTITLPLGISFYTFQSISYVIDVYRAKVKAQKNIFKYSLFVTFFPQLLQGPIGRYDRLAGQLYEGHSYNLKNLQFGAQRILWGFFKKMVIADRLTSPVNKVFYNYGNYGGWTNVFAILMYTVELYADFSGGIDIVIGVAQMLGITLDENFRQPYFARSISEFWRRWHISLGLWMKDYVFYPFSLSKGMHKFGKWCKKKFGNNVGKLMPVSLGNLLVFFIVGVWHGAAWKYIVYGMINGVIIAASGMLAPVYEKIHKKLHINPKCRWYQCFMIIRTFIIVNITNFYDIAPELYASNRMLIECFTKAHISQLSLSTLTSIGLKQADLIVVLIGCLILFIVSVLKERGVNIREAVAGKNIVIRWSLYIGLIMFILLYGSTSGTTDFIYANF